MALPVELWVMVGSLLERCESERKPLPPVVFSVLGSLPSFVETIRESGPPHLSKLLFKIATRVLKTAMDLTQPESASGPTTDPILSLQGGTPGGDGGGAARLSLRRPAVARLCLEAYFAAPSEAEGLVMLDEAFLPGATDEDLNLFITHMDEACTDQLILGLAFEAGLRRRALAAARLLMQPGTGAGAASRARLSLRQAAGRAGRDLESGSEEPPSGALAALLKPFDSDAAGFDFDGCDASDSDHGRQAERAGLNPNGGALTEDDMGEGGPDPDRAPQGRTATHGAAAAAAAAAGPAGPKTKLKAGPVLAEDPETPCLLSVLMRELTDRASRAAPGSLEMVTATSVAAAVAGAAAMADRRALGVVAPTLLYLCYSAPRASAHVALAALCDALQRHACLDPSTIPPPAYRRPRPINVVNSNAAPKPNPNPNSSPFFEQAMTLIATLLSDPARPSDFRLLAAITAGRLLVTWAPPSSSLASSRPIHQAQPQVASTGGCGDDLEAALPDLASETEFPGQYRSGLFRLLSQAAQCSAASPQVSDMAALMLRRATRAAPLEAAAAAARGVLTLLSGGVGGRGGAGGAALMGQPIGDGGLGSRSRFQLLEAPGDQGNPARYEHHLWRPVITQLDTIGEEAAAAAAAAATYTAAGDLEARVRPGLGLPVDPLGAAAEAVSASHPQGRLLGGYSVAKWLRSAGKGGGGDRTYHG